MSLMDASTELTPKNRTYLRVLELYVWEVYKQDLGNGDVTTDNFVKNPRQEVTAHLKMGQSAVLAGVQEAEWFLGRIGVALNFTKQDGEHIVEGDTIMKITGRADRILAGERTLLNLLQRMSGVATLTSRFKDKLPGNVSLLATRKTLWGLLDKRAVTLGGGSSHRLNLSDAILIKDNHLKLSSNLKEDLERAYKKAGKVRFVEIELETEEMVTEFLNVCKELKPPENIVAMLDNFSPAHVKKLAPRLKSAGILVEVSGGVTEENLVDYALPGVSAISVGALTSKAENVDIGLDFG